MANVEPLMQIVCGPEAALRWLEVGRAVTVLREGRLAKASMYIQIPIHCSTSLVVTVQYL